MTHHPHKPPRSKLRQELLLGGLVGVSMLLITGVYAATLRYQNVGSGGADLMPRWSALADGVITRAAPLGTTVTDIKDKLTAIAGARAQQNAALVAMKAKIESATEPL